MNIFVLSTFYLLLATPIDLNPPEIQNLIQDGLEFAYIEEFDSARFYFDSIVSLYPDNPAGYFFKASLLQVKMMDECQFTDEKEYYQLMNQVIKKSEKILDENDNTWAKYYLGSSHTYRAVYEGLKNNYFETLKCGMAGGKILQGIIEKDTTFYDAYLGAGSFEYFWVRAGRYLPLLKLIDGDINEALRKLHVAAERSIYSGPTAQNTLVFVYTEEGNYNQATEIANRLLEAYPNSKTFLWGKATLEYENKKYQSAVDLYNNLFNAYDQQDRKNYANLAQCKLLIGKCFYELKNYDEARKALKDVTSYRKYADKYPPIDEYCRTAYGLLSRML